MRIKKLRVIGIAAAIAALLIPAAVMLSVNAAESDELSLETSPITEAVSETDSNQMVSLYELIEHNQNQSGEFEPVEPVQIEKYVPKKDDILSSFSASAAYNGSYRSELTTGGQFFYNGIHNHYAVEKSNTNICLDLTKDNYYYREWPEVNASVTQEEAQRIYDAFLDDLVNEIYMDCMGACTAFIYDNPQIFWIGSMYPRYYDYVEEENGVRITEIAIYTSAYYEKAFSQMSDFEAGVNKAVAAINASLPENASDYKKTIAVHDYICEKASYDYDAVNAYDFSDYWYTQTAAPIFVDAPDVFKSGNNYFVCAGYAKAFKLLCDRMGLNACTIVGTSYGGGHAWNYVTSDAGIWYAVDTTWDDGRTSYDHDYFMVGSKNFLSAHKADHYLSTISNHAYRFDFPNLSYANYNPNSTSCQHNYPLTCNNEVQPTCSVKGFSGDWYCSGCKQLVCKGQDVDTLPHDIEEIPNNDATCMSYGTVTQICRVCGQNLGIANDYYSPLPPHKYGECEYIDDEYHGSICSVCGYRTVQNHSGGAASYASKAICTGCGVGYGNYLELDMKLNMSAITLSTGQSFKPDVYKYPADCSNAVTWNSSNEAVAKVDSNGVIKAIAKGKADITANLCYCKAVIKVTVSAPSKTPAASVVVNKSEITLEQKCSKLNPTASLSAKITGSSSGKTWFSDNINVATVTPSGKVTAVAEGTAKIYCRTADGIISSNYCTVKVVPSRIESDNMVNNIVYVKPNNTCTLSLNSAIDHGAVTWKSSSPKIAEIDQNGKVAAHAKGTVTITATMADKSKDTVKLIVVNTDPFMTLKQFYANIYIGKTVTLKAVYGTKGSNDAVFWSSSNNAVATVSSKGVVKGIRQGTVTITAKAYGGRVMKATVVVRSKAEGIEFTNVTPALYAPFKQGVFSAKITGPANCNDTITWTSSNPRVVEIDRTSIDGSTIVISTWEPGTAVITAKTGSGKKVSYKVASVWKPAESVTLNMYSADIYVGKSVTLKAKTILPKNCYDVVVWKSLNPEIATVTPDGKVVGIAPGTATIQADSFGGVKNSVKITVRSKATAITVDKSLVNLNVNGSDTIKVASIMPQNCNDKITWTTSSAAVASIVVSDDGKSVAVHGNKKGTATITVKTGSGKSAKIKVVVS